jgi:hypothetical protein
MIAAGTNAGSSLQAAANNIWCAAYSNSGSINFIYAPAVTGSNNCGTAITAFNGNHILVSGYCSGTVNFTSPTISADRDIFMVELDEAGVPVWSTVIIANGMQQPMDIKVNADNQVAISGFYMDDFTVANTTLTCNGSTDAFIIFMDNGNFTSPCSFSGYGEEYAVSLDVTPGGFLAYGYFSGDLNYTMPAGALTIQTTGASDLFVAAVAKPQTLFIPAVYTNSKAVKTYPVPSGGKVNFVIADKSGLTITVYNGAGMKMELPSFVINDNGDVSINTSQLPSGIYTAQIQKGDEINYSRFVEQ